jgi:hypothetical protein
MGKRTRWPLPLLALLLAPVGAAAQAPYPLPAYDLDIQLDTANHVATVRERVTWTNPASRPTDRLVFNAHSHFKLPDKDVGMTAKMFEILRMMPGETLDLVGNACDVRRVKLVDMLTPALPQPAGGNGPQHPPRYLITGAEELLFAYEKDNDCALVVTLPRPVQPGESVTVEIEFVLRLPEVQGRWGHWRGVTCLSNWLPVLAFYDDKGWQPTPYIPWHQPFFNEAGLYTVRLTLPADQKVAATSRVLSECDLGSGLRQIEFAPCFARDFAILCSARFREFVGQTGDVRVSCFAFPEHEYYARFVVQSACNALNTFARWFGPYPYNQFTLVESFFGWHGNECGGLVMIDERIFDMPHAAYSFVDYVVAQGTCHQWWYNVVGTNGYTETWMDEGVATYFAYRLMRLKYGKNDPLVRYPNGLRWLPNVRREDFRVFNLYGTLARGEAGPTVQEIPKYDHIVNLYSMAYERGGKVFGMIEDRLGEERFLGLMRHVYARYHFRILRVADFQRELEAYSGNPWGEFFRNWVYGSGLTDWCVEKVTVHPAPLSPAGRGASEAYKVTVLLRQKAEYNEPTVLGFCLNRHEVYMLRVPIIPQAGVVELPEIPARVEPLAENRLRVEVTLPCRPTQITVDPDEVLVDRNPCNNYWKPHLRFRLTPLYTFLDENDLTNAHDRWNIIAGPWVFAPTYDNPFFTRATRFGIRAGAYRTSTFEGGVYTAYRTDYRDFVTGVDAVLEHWPYAHAELGLVAERRLVGTLRGETNANRGVLYARHVIDYGDSLYLPPFQYIEAFGTISDDLLPFARQTAPGAERFKHQTMLGLHYHLNYLTPYWDAEGGFAADVSYAEGVEVPGEGEGIANLHQVMGQFVYVQSMPDGLGWLSDTRWAFRVYGAFGLPSRVQYFALGGGEIFRGFDLAQRQGSAMWVGSVEWRVPLLRHVNWGVCDRALEVRNVYGALFTDVGSIYLNGRSLGGIAEAVGAGLRIDVSWFTFVERTILRLDAAQTVNARTPPQFWIGIEHPF